MHRDFVCLSQVHVLRLEFLQVARIQLLVHHHQRLQVVGEEVAEEHPFGGEDSVAQFNLVLTAVAQVNATRDTCFA